MDYNPFYGTPWNRVGVRRVFISYHHGLDRPYYDEFSRLAAGTYQAIEDNSVRSEIDSENPDYVMRRIREDFITGTSCTIVLCGAETWKRKYVDWEIKATLDKEHGLIGLNLPTSRLDVQRHVLVPNRYLDNYQSGYATWYNWIDFTGNPFLLRQWVEEANARSKSLIRNMREMRARNACLTR
jgi:hypothetical protein